MNRAPFPRLASIALPWRLAVLVLATGLIAAASFSQGGGAEPDSAAWSLLLNLGHVPLFGFLAGSFLLCLGAEAPFKRGACAATVGLTLGVGWLDEWHQGTVPGRHADVRDLVTDLLGCLLAVGIARWASRLPLRVARAAAWLLLAVVFAVLWGWFLVSSPATPLPFPAS